MPEQSVLDVLKAARELISVPERWTQGSYARNRSGRTVFASAPRAAVCWCAVGALRRVTDHQMWLVNRAVYTLRGALDDPDGGMCALSKFNDVHTHPEVLALFDTTIARLEKEQSHV